MRYLVCLVLLDQYQVGVQEGLGTVVTKSKHVCLLLASSDEMPRCHLSLRRSKGLVEGVGLKSLTVDY